MDITEKNPTEVNILTTLAWFDLFDHPLTVPELAYYSRITGAKFVSGDLIVRLLENNQKINKSKGYYFLADRDLLPETRQRRFRLSRKKIRRAHLAAKLFGLLPSVRLVALCNSLAFNNAEEESDIDLFLVCRSHTLWTTRLILAGTLKLLKLRPTPKIQRDRLCLSFFISDTALNLSWLSLPGGDPYFRFWLLSLVPLYDDGNVYERLILANTWIFESKLSEPIQKKSSTETVKLNRLEQLARQLQQKKFPPAIKELINLDSRVVVTDEVLKFHVDDRRQQYRENFKHRLNTLGLNSYDF